MVKKEERKICNFCGGSGQLSFFKGASRFLLSTGECEECAGTGWQLQADERGKETGKTGKNGKRGSKKRQ